MRVIGGSLKGIRLSAPAKLPARPTTDLAKEAIFNILQNSYELENCSVLDLFSGIGSISIEFASRGAQKVDSVDKHPGSVNWIKSVAKKYELTCLNTFQSDYSKYIEQCKEKYDIIFADPPYDMPNIAQIATKIQQKQLLDKDGILIIEHPSLLKMEQQAGFVETRKYGYSSFSFFTF